MKKGLLLLALLVIGTSLVLSGCGGGKKAEAPKDGAPLVLKLGHTHNGDETSSIHVFALKLQELLKPKGIDLKIFPGSQLGGDRDMHEQMRLGSLDMNVSGTATIADKYPQIGVLDLPYIWKDYDHVHKVVDGETGKKLAEGVLKATNLRILGYPDSFGFRNVASNKEVRSIEDLKNLKLRTIGTPTYIGTFKALGAAPVAMGFGEVYTSIQTKVIDGWEHEPPTLYSSKTYEICKYLTKTDHLYGVLIAMISDKAWAKLNDQQKKDLTAAVADAIKYERSLVPQKTENMYKALKDKDMTIIEIDKKPLMEATKAFREQWVKENKVEDFYKEIMK